MLKFLDFVQTTNNLVGIEKIKIKNKTTIIVW
jgi:hypothetical protein